jgi:hypothetical protein
MENAMFKLRGLDPGAVYSVRDLDWPGELRFSGWELEKHGLPVEIEREASAVVITYQQVKGSH